MMNNLQFLNVQAWGTFPGWFPPLVVLFALWSLFWKGLALWHSGRRGEPWWFIILLLVNTMGILEIIYLFGVAKLKPDQLFSAGKSHPHHT